MPKIIRNTFILFAAFIIASIIAYAGFGNEGALDAVFVLLSFVFGMIAAIRGKQTFQDKAIVPLLVLMMVFGVGSFYFDNALVKTVLFCIIGFSGGLNFALGQLLKVKRPARDEGYGKA